MTLGPELSAEVEWAATTTRVEGPLADLIRAGLWDINKMVHYLPVYEAAFGDPERPVRLLEIGVNFGGSLELWRQYLTHPDTVIVGIDSNARCVRYDHPDRNVFVRCGNQQDTTFLQAVVDEHGPFDVIIDDGSHIPAFTLASFRHLFLHGLRDGGAYIVEDLHTCYSSDCREPFPDKSWLRGANDGSPQFTEVIKQLIDTMHAHYLQTDTGDGVDKLEPDNPKYVDSFRVPRATNLIQSIEIHDAIAVIRRGPRDLTRMLRRWSSHEMTAILGRPRYFRKYPHLEHADKTRMDWFS